MKKIMLLSMLGMVLFSELSNATEIKPCICAPAGIWIKLHINLHRPKFDCERGFGICAFVTAGFDKISSPSEKNLCLVRGQLNERNQLVIEIDETTLINYEGGSSVPYFKDKTSIPIMDPYTIPDATCRALGANTPLTIKPGNYPVSYQNGTYTIVFQL
ncbi:MAG: hypothetical protein Q8M08_01535 [Bacteroidales bacterium]|nr:hypothetical protein [Bacteroidales bacterium]